MMRSMFSGVAGLRNHQTAMDVIGANISNVNTVGYKGGRSNFSDVISQTMQGAASATGTRGGTNPVQVGLGMGLSAVDTIMTSGSYQPTGKQTDLAIQNQGFFIISDGLNQYYTRAGAFDFDAAGNYVVPATGMKVMGWQGVDGVVDTSGQVNNIVIPAGITLPAVATTGMTFINNLSGTDTPGSSAQTSLEVYDSLGKVQTLQNKFVKTDSVNNKWLTQASLSDKSLDIDNALTEVTFDSAGKVSTIKQVTPLSAFPSTSINFKAGMQLDSSTTTTHYTNNFTLFDTAGVGREYVAEFVGATATTATMKIYAASDTAHSNPLNGAAGTAVTFAAGAYTSPAITVTDPDAAVPYTIAALNVSGTAMADGKFTGRVVPPGTTALSIPSLQLDNTTGSVHEAYYTVFDNELTPHVLKMEFTQTASNAWSYKLTEAGVANATAKLSGAINYSAGPPVTYTFVPLLSTNSFDVGSGSATTSITFADPTVFVAPAGTSFVADSNPTYGTSTTVNPVEYTPTGANKVSIAMNINGLTQYGGSTTVQASSQNGNAAGALDTVSIDTSGMIVGKFSNGKTQNLARVALATFINSGGLTRVGDSIFAVSNNSGNPSIGTSGTGGRGTMTPGTLEMSNIDLADQFSKMIITQRGFQANSKIITTSDSMLEELVNLKR